ncbi:hypothetical protein, conserved [Eimeria maxima]|uniref:Coiled-coil domain-containing protein 86 n=1 Tax=Eimeria maxima TaxID=5804 RepID=U6M270_EIMMA|nr:hypothetical protein, conserved [Eimeria maxima]CDJ58342.1 hypothetical protein, conserved [Eimeria maxima]
MQHVDAHSAIAAPTAHQGTAASNTSAGAAAAATSVVADAVGSDAFSNEHQHHSSKKEGPDADATTAEQEPTGRPVEEGVPLPTPPAVADENATAHSAPAVRSDDQELQIEGGATITTEVMSEAAASPNVEEIVEDSPSISKEGEHLPSESNKTIPRRMGRQMWRPRGQRLSFGRLCKGSSAPGGCVGDSTAAKKRWEQVQQQKAKQREARDSEKQIRAVKEKVRVQRRKQREAKRQRKKENEMKSAKVQVIKDTSKIRKWNKRARRQLVKMSPEMIRQLYGVQI